MMTIKSKLNQTLSSKTFRGKLESPQDYMAFYMTWFSVFHKDPDRDTHYQNAVLNIKEDIELGNLIENSWEHKTLQNFYQKLINEP